MHINLCTYADVRGAGATVVGFAELAVGLAARAGIPLRIRVDREDARRPKAGRRLTEQTWRKIREVIIQGDYTTLLVFNDSTLGLRRRVGRVERGARRGIQIEREVSERDFG